MNREEFIKLCMLFGVGMSYPQIVLSCTKDTAPSEAFPGKVIIIGAGAGGLSAGYFLKQQQTEFEILEASDTYGGRMRINTDFTDFPIPLGAEWLETHPRVFQEIVNDASVRVNVPTIADDPDRKFINYSWFQFFEDYLLPSVQEKISFQTVVRSIDYAGTKVVVNTQRGTYTADKVVLSVPLKILQEGHIRFNPELPAAKTKAIQVCEVWDGFKAFFEFSTKFYEDAYEFNHLPKESGQKLYYNAAYGQPTSKHILGLFAVGAYAQELVSLSGKDLEAFILAELDGIYGGLATPNYVKHMIQNWNNEPFIKGGYLSDFAPWRTVRELGRSVGNKLYFAGGAFTDGEDWVSVHTAAKSAKAAVREINR